MRIRRRLVGGLVLAALCLPAGSAAAAPGELDKSFGNGGKSTIDLGGDETAFDLALEPGGKILVSGQQLGGGASGGDLLVAKVLNPQGVLDPDYGLGSGWSRLDFGNAGGGNLALQPDGRIVVTGVSVSGGPTFSIAIARLLNPGGASDTSFHSPTGANIINLAGSSFELASDAALRPGGQILVGGTTRVHGTADFAVAQIRNPEGTLDTSYGLSTGGSAIDFAGGNDFGAALALQSDGRIVVVGAAAPGPGATNRNFGIARVVSPEGTFDNSFGINGRTTIDFGDASANAVALQPDGKIVVAGTAHDDFAIARLMPNGDLDKSFGGGGKAIVDLGSVDQASELAVQSDGKILVAGATGTLVPDLGRVFGNFALARLQPNGSLDTTFGNGGLASISLGPPASAISTALEEDGDIILAGGALAANEDLALARVQGDPPGNVAEKCAGKKATVIGTNAKDKLKGTKKRDVISAGKGNDTVNGLGGNDLICGGKGKDGLFGGAKKDTLLGEASKDRLFGGKAKDTLKGGKGKDLLVGGPANDKLNGGPGRDTEKQ